MEVLAYADLKAKVSNSVQLLVALSDKLRSNTIVDPKLTAFLELFSQPERGMISQLEMESTFLHEDGTPLDRYLEPFLNSEFSKQYSQFEELCFSVEHYLNQFVTGQINAESALSNLDRVLKTILENTQFFLYTMKQSKTWLKALKMSEREETMDSLQTQWAVTYKRTRDEAEKLLNSVKTESDTLLESLTRMVGDTDVAEIKKFYVKAMEPKRNQGRFLSGAFYVTFFVLIAILIGFIYFEATGHLPLFSDPTLGNSISASPVADYKSNIPLYFGIITLLGFGTFLMTDLRKRLNINRSIRDELEQKVILADSYSVLLSKARENEGQIEFSRALLANIIQQLLYVRNHGYTAKEMMNHSPYPVWDLASQMLDRGKKEEGPESKK